MTDLWFADEQSGSLARFMDTDAAGYGIGGALDYGLSLLGGLITVERLEFGEPRWIASDRWSRRLWLTLTQPADGDTRTVAIEVPALVDDTALKHLPRGVVPGGHRGTFWEHPHYPLTVFTRAPGVRFVAWQLKSELRLVVELVPIFGSPVRLSVLAPKTGPYVEVSGPNLRDRAKFRRFNLDLTWRPPRRKDPEDELLLPEQMPDLFSYLQTGGNVGRFDARLLDTDLERLGDAAREDAGSATLTTQDLRLIIDALVPKVQHYLGLDAPTVDPHDDVLVPLDPRNWAPRQYGDLLTVATSIAVTRSMARLSKVGQDRISLDAVGGVMRSDLGTEYRALATGKGVYSTAVSSERQLNTIARVELARQHTFLGPFGLEGYNGRMDLRVLPPGWLDRLCPVQTPESKKVGLVRHAALGTLGAPAGHATDYSDVSIAASLVPFLNHDDPTRIAIGAKMFKQALRVDNAQPPVVRTGGEEFFAEELGLVRAPANGVVTAVGSGLIQLDETPICFGPPQRSASGQNTQWVVTVEKGAYVRQGEVIAHAPDVMLSPDESSAVLQLGLDALVSFLPWHGWNYEDGIVVSESFAARLSSTHVIRLTAELDQETESVWELIASDALGEKVRAGTPVLRIINSSDAKRDLSFPEDALVLPHEDPDFPFEHFVERDTDEVAVRFQVTRPLQVGDKLTTRHGGKGVVTRVEPDAAMPRLPGGRIVEVLLNPLGVLRRLNVGTIFELNVGLATLLEAGNKEPKPEIVGRRLGTAGRKKLASRLSKLKAPGGRLPLTLADGAAIGPAEGSLVGPLYLLKLEHLAKVKAGGRWEAGPSPVSFQPAKTSGWGLTRKQGSPQRIGEMEGWALQAVGATKFLDDVLRHRGVGNRELRGRSDMVGPAMRATIAHLAVAGLHVEGELHSSVPGMDATEWVDLTVDPQVSVKNVKRLELRWQGSSVDGSELHAGLRDIYDFLESAEREVSTPSGVNFARVAERVLDLALAEYAGIEGLPPSSGRSEDVYFHIPLAAPVVHPWTVPGLPPIFLESVALLPLECFASGKTADWHRDFIRQSYLALMLANFEYADALEWNAMAREQSMKERSLTTIHDELTRRVHKLLGYVSDGPAEGTIAGRLQGKFGILRRNLLGTSTIRSGRAVLVGDPTQSLEQVGLPRWLLEDLGLPRERSTKGFEDVVVVNRQPTLLPYTLIALRAVASPNDSVSIHPYLLQSLAGDFDGDTIAVHRATTEDAREEIWNLRRPSSTLRSSAAGSLLAKLDLDVGVGLLLGTEGKAERVKLAAAMSEVLPSPVVVPKPLGEPSAVQELAEQSVSVAGDASAGARRKAVDAMAVMMGFAFEAVMAWGFSLVDLPDVSSSGAALSDDQVGKLLAEALSRDEFTRLRQAFNAKAAGKEVDLVQLLIRRGDAVSPNSLMPVENLTGNYIDGLPTEEYFLAAQPAVASLAAKKLVTPRAGALTKVLVDIGYEIVIEGEHCGYRGGDHSPLTCITSNPCQQGYGIDPGTSRLADVGSRVGIFAGMLIGEKSTQLAMKSIHQRGKNSGLTASLSELSGIFGVPRTSFRVPDASGALGENTNLLNLFLAAPEAELTSAKALTVAVRRFTQLLEGQVAVVHAQVLLRRFLDAYKDLSQVSNMDELKPRHLFREAIDPGCSLAKAATWGELAFVVRGTKVGSEHPRPHGEQRLARLRLMMGVVSDE